MKSKIQVVYPQSVFCSSTASKLYIADFTERTNSSRKVEFHEIIPQVPDSNTDMDCLVFENSAQFRWSVIFLMIISLKMRKEKICHIANVCYSLKVSGKI